MAVISTFMARELTQLTDEALVAEAKRLAAVERQATAELLLLLIELERRGLHLALGYSSMFTYCTRALRMSEQAAYKRITAARTAKRYPTIVDLLVTGALTLSSVKILAPHLTEENVDAMLEAARGKSTREVEALIAVAHPQPDVPASVRALPEPKSALLDSGLAMPESVATAPVLPAQRPRPRPVVAPIAPRRYLLKVSVGQETYDKLQQVRGLLRHSHPDGDLEAILDRALVLLLRDTERRRIAATSRPRQSATGETDRRHVPAAIRRAVWTRDSGRCALVGPDGRCGETAFLEFHHVVPFSTGGRPAVATSSFGAALTINTRHERLAYQSQHGDNQPAGPLPPRSGRVEVHVGSAAC
jgi:5-methylcytosine-specific restriction endonuclease McrA